MKLDESEIAGLEKDFSAILEYVGQVSAVTVDGSREAAPQLHNVMRDDVAVQNAPGNARESLLEAFPRREGDYDVVRQIIEK